MQKRTIEQLPLDGRRVLMRVDFNVPLANGMVKDDTRILASLPSIKYALAHNARLILMSHLGRPKGQPKSEFSMAPVAQRLAEILGQPVAFAADCVGPAAEAAVADLAPGQALVLENLRFHAEEEKNGGQFAQQLAALGDVYINDAFGSSHRAHASVVGVPALLAESGVGYLMLTELNHLGRLLEHPPRPFAVLLGGAKVSDKIGVISNLLNIADTLLIGGAMAFTFLRAQGLNTGKSLVEEDKLDLARELLAAAETKHVKLLLPVDVTGAGEIKPGITVRIVPAAEIPDELMGLDIGPKTIAQFKQALTGAATIFWNGPMGVFEVDGFDRGTLAMAQTLVQSGAMTVVGGGDSVSALNKTGLQDKITHISTGGGASLEFMEGQALPGVVAIPDAL